MPRFGLFKKKDGSTSKFKSQDSTVDSRLSGDRISISEARLVLNEVESRSVKDLSVKLSRIKMSVEKSLRHISELADSLEEEKIKLDEPKFESIVHNSRKTVVSSLRREATSDLPLPESIADARNFKEKLESKMNRFEEVSSSHNRVFNIFMKKYAGKLGDEFEMISVLFKETKVLIIEFEDDIDPILKCSSLLDALAQKVTSIETTETSVKKISARIEELEANLRDFEIQLGNLESSHEFQYISHSIRELHACEKVEQQLHEDMISLFARVSRAFTKYSYGLSKDISARLQILVEEPWNIFAEADISPYVSLLSEVRKSLKSGKISLKDSEKSVYNFDLILKSLPEYGYQIKRIKDRLVSLHHFKNEEPIRKSRELREKIVSSKQELENCRNRIQDARQEVLEKNRQLEIILNESQTCVNNITSHKYILST
jgi:hypothetical protein